MKKLPLFGNSDYSINTLASLHEHITPWVIIQYYNSLYRFSWIYDINLMQTFNDERKVFEGQTYTNHFPLSYVVQKCPQFAEVVCDLLLRSEEFDIEVDKIYIKFLVTDRTKF